MNKRGFLFFVLLLGNIFTTVMGKDSTNYIVTKDLQDDWLIYDKDYKSYFPLLDPQDKSKIISASQLIDLNRYKDYFLEFKASPGLAVFIENELVYEADAEFDSIMRLPIAQLPKLGGTKINEKSVITFYDRKGLETLKNIAIVKDLKIRIAAVKNPTIIYPRHTNQLGTLYTLTFLFILGGVAVIKTRFSKKFSEFLGVSSLFPSMDENPLWDILSTPVLVLLGINSLCVSLVLFVIKREYDLESLNFLNIFAGKAVLGIILVGLVVFLIYILKYIQIKFTGWIFNLSEIGKIQFFELMKVSLKVNFLLTVLILIFYSTGYFKVNFQFQYFVYFALATLLIVLFRVGYLVFAYSGFRNVYLFSYLCATEILPLVIIIKLILF